MKDRAEKPFHFFGCIELHEILGKSAENERELADLTDEVPQDSIFYHTHSHLLRHYFIEREYLNDFADWVSHEVEDRVLGERLAIIDPSDCGSLETLRGEIISIIDDHLSEARIVPRVIFGEPFEFMQTRVVEVPTDKRAYTLEEIRQCLEEVDISSIFFHFFEARLRLQRKDYDLPLWLMEELGMNELAEKIRQIKIYSISLEQLRSRLISLCEWTLGERRGSL